jgi:hypothetical protein
MTQLEEDDHEDLQRLFSETAIHASNPTLTKLAARAADIPGRVLRKRIFPRWAWGPAFAGAIVALGGLLLALRATRPPREATQPRAPELGSSAAVASLTVASASAREVNADAPSPSDEASDSPELLGDADEGARFDVSGPQSDRDLDAWLAATKDLSGGT